MPLPATNKTLHLNASDNDHIWKAYQAGTPYHNGVPVDGDTIDAWESEDSVLSALAAASGNRPIWRQSAPGMLLPCLDFDGTDDSMMVKNIAGTVSKILSDIFTASAKTFYIAFRIEGVVTANAGGTAYNNEGLFAESGGYFGVHLRNQGAGVYKVQIYNYTSAANTIELTILLNTNYILKVRHTGGTLYASLNGGAETSLASGNTASLTGVVEVGRSNGNKFLNGRIGEIVTYNIHQTAQDQIDSYDYLANKWLPPVPPGQHRMFSVF